MRGEGGMGAREGGRAGDAGAEHCMHFTLGGTMHGKGRAVSVLCDGDSRGHEELVQSGEHDVVDDPNVVCDLLTDGSLRKRGERRHQGKRRL